MQIDYFRAKGMEGNRKDTAEILEPISMEDDCVHMSVQSLDTPDLDENRDLITIEGLSEKNFAIALEATFAGKCTNLSQSMSEQVAGVRDYVQLVKAHCVGSCHKMQVV